MRGGSLFLAACALLALGLAGLGLLPWAKTGTPWRPARPALESAAAAHWDPGLIERGREYRSSGYGRWFLRKGVVGLLLTGLLAFGGHLVFRRLPFGGSPAGPVLALVLAFLVLSLVNLPFGLLAEINARRFGLSTQSWGPWFGDWGKSLLISLAITAVVGAGLFWLMHRLPRAWPLPATLLAAAGGILMALLVPLLIDPLFNTFEPLADRALANRFLDLARRGGVPATEVLVTDASRRTTALNAYFTGFGPTRRIVVYDNLVRTLPPKEAELVLAHEVGHWARHHIVKGLVLGTLGLGLALLLGQALLGLALRQRWFGLNGALDPAAIPFYLLLYWLGLFLSLPLENGVSRLFERESDRFALELTGDAATQVAVEQSLGRTNLADLVPPPLIEGLLYTHPKTLDRIAQAEEWARANPRPTPEALP